jgi:hypothetical protein
METTVLTKKWPVSRNKFNEVIFHKLVPHMQKYIQEFNELTEKIKAVCKGKKQIRITNIKTTERVVFSGITAFFKKRCLFCMYM